MKKNALFVLIICALISCNQSHKVSENKTQNKESSISLNEKKTVVNIDALNASPANFKLLLENQYVRVLEYIVEPGKKDEWHTHPAKSSYVVSGGQLKVYLENGEIILADEVTGTVSWMNNVGKHYVENIGKSAVKIILTENKSLEKSY